MSFLQGAAQAVQDPNNQAKFIGNVMTNPVTKPGVEMGAALANLIRPPDNKPMQGSIKPGLAGDRDIRSGERAPNAQQWMDVFTRGGG